MQLQNDKLYRQFLLCGHLEGVSFLILLGIAMPLKYLAGMPKAVGIAGMLHGLLFIAFCFFLYRVYDELKWPAKKIFMAFLLSLLPFGTFFLKKLG